MSYLDSDSFALPTGNISTGTDHSVPLTFGQSSNTVKLTPLEAAEAQQIQDENKAKSRNIIIGILLLAAASTVAVVLIKKVLNAN